MTGTVIIDLETADADRLYRGGHRGPFVRLAGARALDGSWEHVGAPDAAFLHILRDATVLVGHNLQRFDIPALARHYQTDHWALARKVVDTLPLARRADPPGARKAKPWSVRGYYGLQALSERLGLPGKTDDLPALASEHGGYDRIPVDDARYRSYLSGDLAASGALYTALLPSLDAYARREMHVSAVQSRMTLNGWRIDVPLLNRRIDRERRTQTDALETLHRVYALPRTGGKAPLSSGPGRAWFAAGLEYAGISDPPRTKTGPSIGGDALQELAARPNTPPGFREALDLMLIVAGTTAKYQEIGKHLVGDRVYPGIGDDQAAGRWGMTGPATSNLGKRDGKVEQREPFTGERGHVMITFDLDQVDMRGIAGLCQDPAYMALFAPGMDAHSMIAEAVFGRSDGPWRQKSKKCGHGWNYGMGISGLVRSGVEIETARRFDSQMKHRFPVLCGWREEIRALGESGALLDNGWGRLMRCSPERAYTQAPALMGQGSARDLMCEGLLRLDPGVHHMLRGVVHDEIVMSVPVEQVREVTDHVLGALTFTWRGVPITAGVSAPGENWAACYAK